MKTKAKRPENTPYSDLTKAVKKSEGGLYLPNGYKLDFVKDPAKLLYQYRNLILSVCKMYTASFTSNYDREDLYVYVVDTFISLTLEYDPDKGVDFTGYIDKNLKQRVKYSYVQKVYKNKSRSTLLKSETGTVDDILLERQARNQLITTDKDGSITDVSSPPILDVNAVSEDKEFQNLIEEYSQVVNLNDLEKLILEFIYIGYSDSRKINTAIQKHFPNKYSRKKVYSTYEGLKEFLEHYYEL